MINEVAHKELAAKLLLAGARAGKRANCISGLAITGPPRQAPQAQAPDRLERVAAKWRLPVGQLTLFSLSFDFMLTLRR